MTVSTPSPNSHSNPDLNPKQARYLFTAVRDGSLLQLLLARGRAEAERLSRGLHASAEWRSRPLAEQMVIREESSTWPSESTSGSAQGEATPDPPSEEATHAQALKAHGTGLTPALTPALTPSLTPISLTRTATRLP